MENFYELFDEEFLKNQEFLSTLNLDLIKFNPSSVQVIYFL